MFTSLIGIQGNFYEYNNMSKNNMKKNQSSDSDSDSGDRRAEVWNSFGFSQIVQEDKFWPQSLSKVAEEYINIVERVNVPEPSCGTIMFNYLEKERVLSELREKAYYCNEEEFNVQLENLSKDVTFEKKYTHQEFQKEISDATASPMDDIYHRSVYYNIWRLPYYLAALVGNARPLDSDKELSEWAQELIQRVRKPLTFQTANKFQQNLINCLDDLTDETQKKYIAVAKRKLVRFHTRLTNKAVSSNKAGLKTLANEINNSHVLEKIAKDFTPLRLQKELQTECTNLKSAILAN